MINVQVFGSQIHGASRSIPIQYALDYEILASLDPVMKKQRRVKQEAERVVEEGGFSFPWLKITQPNGQLLTIFGSDRLEFLANWLGKEWKGPNTSVSNPQESRL
ncbi:hypothetical protein KEM48_003164 [Puccinia striiformis f. sp. tritici PST-130]|nr:hypothetical protein KEM48_003164 [Puccinia striiformis f. sp. tritici PST-130]